MPQIFEEGAQDDKGEMARMVSQILKLFPISILPQSKMEFRRYLSSEILQYILNFSNLSLELSLLPISLRPPSVQREWIRSSNLWEMLNLESNLL